MRMLKARHSAALDLKAPLPSSAWHSGQPPTAHCEIVLVKACAWLRAAELALACKAMPAQHTPAHDSNRKAHPSLGHRQQQAL